MGSTGCMVLLMLPFAGAGVFTGVLAVRAALMREWTQAVLLCFFALTFGGLGFGGIVGFLKGGRRLAATKALRDSHAGTPWLWRPDWAAGVVDDGTRTTARFAWVFAIFWNLVSLPAAYFGMRDALEKGNHAAFLALLFPVVGFGLLVWAVRSTLRYRRYGVSRFELTTIPGVIGHSLEGTVRVSEPLRPEEGIRMALVCLRRRTTRTGKSQSTSETTLWREDRSVSGGGVSIPVAFAIPPDALPSDDRNPNDRLIWRLEMTANVPGVDYGSSFEVPVFRTALSDQPRSEEEEKSARDPAIPAAYRQPATSEIRVMSNRRGTEILYPPARNPGAAMGLTAFFLVWCAAIWACLHFGAPAIFSIIFGLFGILLLAGVIELWFKVTRVTVDSGGVTVAKGYLVTGAGRTIGAGEVADVKPKIGMQAGATPYYDVSIVLKDGKTVAAGTGVRDKREAEWLATVVKKALDCSSIVEPEEAAG